MKDSIYFVPIAEDFIDLEHLLRISSASFDGYGGVIISLRYMFQKDAVIIGVRAIELFDAEEAKQYSGYKLPGIISMEPGNALGEKFKNDAIKKFDEKVRRSIYNAWSAYRERKQQ